MRAENQIPELPSIVCTMGRKVFLIAIFQQYHKFVGTTLTNVARSGTRKKNKDMYGYVYTKIFYLTVSYLELRACEVK